MKVKFIYFLLNEYCIEKVSIDDTDIYYASSPLEWRMIDEDTISVNGAELYFPADLVSYDTLSISCIVNNAYRDDTGELYLTLMAPCKTAGSHGDYFTPEIGTIPQE